MESFVDEFNDQRREKSGSPVIAVDGLSGAGKDTVASFVSERFGIRHISASDAFYEIAEERGLSETELSAQAGKGVDLEIDRRTLQKALSGACVIDSRIAAHVLGTYADLRIRVEADPEERARRIGERDDIDSPVPHVQTRDREDSRRYQQYYSIDTSDLSVYHLVLDNTDVDIEPQNRIIESAVENTVM